MKHQITSSDPINKSTNCLILPVFSKRRLSGIARRVDDATAGELKKLIRKSGFEGDRGQTLVLYGMTGLKAARLMLVGCGSFKEFSVPHIHAILQPAVKQLESDKCNDAVIVLPFEAVEEKANFHLLREAATCTSNAVYRFDQCKSEEKKAHRIKALNFAVDKKASGSKGKDAVAQGEAIGGGMSLARDLANLPGNICTPSYLADQARKLGRKHETVKTRVIDERGMEKLGMGALLSVSRGSRQPAKLIIMEYRGAAKSQKPVVLVGKGLTFDAGGISLKPSAKMDEMKYDMCGGASVFGAIESCARLGLPLNVIGVVPSSENLPDGDANKPGDIVTSMSGQTIEVLNTDAEGRLILCDALTYIDRFNPAEVIDVATLTGACIVALGNHASGLMANDDSIADRLSQCGEKANDRVWRLPIWDDYQKQLDSNFADIANIGGPAAGTITAACFLSRFTDKYRWAHLDIAGTAWVSGNDKGATGRPVPLLVNYLLNKCRKDY